MGFKAMAKGIKAIASYASVNYESVYMLPFLLKRVKILGLNNIPILQSTRSKVGRHKECTGNRQVFKKKKHLFSRRACGIK